MPKKKILICGATGFIGRNIAERFASKDEYEVFGTYFNSEPYNYPGLTLIKADLRKPEDVDWLLAGKDIIIQAAATTSGAKDIVNRPFLHVTDNAIMNSLIFRSAYEHGVSHLIFFSCSVMYQPSDRPVKEEDFDANKEIHKNYFGVGWTKVYLEKMCEFYSRIGPTKYTVIRHSNIYGPYDKFDLERSHVFGATITKVLSAKDDDKIIVWGTGEEGRDLLYVSDLVDFVELILEKQETKFEIINVGYGKSIAICDLVQKIVDASGKNLSIEYDKTKPTIKTKLALDITKARNFGWAPKISLEEGIKKTIAWWNEIIKNY